MTTQGGNQAKSRTQGDPAGQTTQYLQRCTAKLKKDRRNLTDELETDQPPCMNIKWIPCQTMK